MDLTYTTSNPSLVLTVVGLKADGTPGSFASPPTFTVESGPVKLSEVADPNSQALAIDNSAVGNAVIRVDANCDLSGGTRIVTARLNLSIGVPSPAGPPSNEVVDLKLTAQ